MLKAAVDIGTNTFNLIIADRVTGEILYKEKQAVRLGMGGISKGVITDDAVERAIQTLQAYKATIEKYEVEQTVVTATSAVRNAANQNEFVDRVLSETGFEVQVLSGHEEASYIYQGVKRYMKIAEGNELIVDIGGGSIEFIIADKKKPLWMKSLEIGGQRLMDKFHTHDPITQQDIDRLNNYLTTELEEVMRQCDTYAVTSLIGSAGSFDTLYDMYLLSEAGQGMSRSEATLPVDAFLNLCDELVMKNRDERLQIPGMIAMRADMIVVASLLIKLVVQRLNIARLRVSAFALKEGVLFSDDDKIGMLTGQ